MGARPIVIGDNTKPGHKFAQSLRIAVYREGERSWCFKGALRRWSPLRGGGVKFGLPFGAPIDT
jgi:hypothetical protein